MNRLKTNRNLATRRPRCFLGAVIGAVGSIAGSIIGANAQKRERRRQERAQDYTNMLETAKSDSAAMNSMLDYNRNYLSQFNTVARLGTSKRSKLNSNIFITDGGDAVKIDKDTYLLRGGSHEQTNETGQTGIGINVGGNEIEAEGGEVAQKKNGALRIFSAQPMLGGVSPAQAVMRGANKDKVFNAQQAFKKRHHLTDGGGKARHGTAVPYSRIHINDDGTFTDTLDNKNYTTSATNGEDVVITGKANRWKEAGKKDTSSYFDPMGAVNFATAAGAPILNANPSNIVGSIRDSKNASDFLKHYMMQDTGGFVNTKWAKEHPYLSLGINTIGDIGLGYGLGKTGVGLYRLRPSNLRKHIFENISPIGYDKPIPRIKEAFKSALSGAEADIDNPSWFNDKSAQDLNTYNVGITKNMFGPHALEARFDAWRKYLGLPQKFNTWTESPIVKGAYTDTKGISNLKVLPKDQSVDFINSAGGNVANNIEEFTTRGYNGQKYGVSHIRDTWDLQPWSRLRGNIIEDKVIRPLYNSTIGKANRKVSSSLHKFINKYGYDNEAIQKYLNENGEEALDNLSDVIEYFADTKSIKGKLAHKLSGLDDVLNDKAYYTINKDSKLSKLTNKLSDKIKNFEASSLLPGAKPFKIAYDIPWTNEVFPNNEMVKGFNMINTLPTEAYRYKLKNPLLDYTYRLGGRCKLRNGGLTSKDRGSSKHPYPSVSSKDFAGGGRSYPIPTKADAVDALRLAGLHGRSDVKAKVYDKYPSLRKKARGGTVVEPYYDWARNTSSNLDISFIDPTYDYRAYYNSVTPYERNLVRFAPQGTHFTDIGKTPKHPTFSNESKYSNKKTPGGTWNGNVFVPSIWQFGNNGNNIRNKYMNNSGEGYFNGSINVFPTSRKKHSLGGRIKARIGGSWTAPVYNTNKYRVSNRMRRQIATWEGSDFAGQNRKFKGDAIGAKERELRQIMGRTYNYLNDNQRDSLNSIYYNSRVDTFKNKFNKWFKNLNDAVDRGDERAFNNSLAGIRQSMNIGANRKGMSGLAKRRAWEQDWFGNPIPMDSNETKAILKQQADARMIQPVDNTRVVIQPQYIEVPTPVGHGIIPVDNPNPNLLQGNIKDNLINMGTRFRLGQRCGGSTRVRKALGGESRPVKGMRRKFVWGDVTYPYRRNNDFDYWTAIDQEQKANDKGGITPWTTSNKYDVKPPLAITKTTPTIPYQNVVTPVTTKSKEDNSGSNNKSTNKLGATFKNVDWASLGADLIGTIGAGIIGTKAAGNVYIPDAPVRYQASKLDTNYNITPQLETIRRSRNRLANEVAGNTSSSVAALNRLNLLETNANEQLNKLYDTKENRESELLNQDALNQQAVSAQNVQAMNDYNYRVAELRNARTQGVGNVLSGTLQGIGNSFQNFFSQGRQNYDDTQAMLMGVAASDYATPSRLLELGVDVGDDAALAGIYRSAMNIPNPGARPKREDYSDNTEYSYALTRWENQNKAYQRRNSYADLIKGRMNRKNLIKYGII